MLRGHVVMGAKWVKIIKCHFDSILIWLILLRVHMWAFIKIDFL